jgi:hypothetical protein
MDFCPNFHSDGLLVEPAPKLSGIHSTFGRGVKISYDQKYRDLDGGYSLDDLQLETDISVGRLRGIMKGEQASGAERTALSEALGSSELALIKLGRAA